MLLMTTYLCRYLSCLPRRIVLSLKALSAIGTLISSFAYCFREMCCWRRLVVVRFAVPGELLLSWILFCRWGINCCCPYLCGWRITTTSSVVEIFPLSQGLLLLVFVVADEDLLLSSWFLFFVTTSCSLDIFVFTIALSELPCNLCRQCAAGTSLYIGRNEWSSEKKETSSKIQVSC